jgi:hypothetical protein
MGLRLDLEKIFLNNARKTDALRKNGYEEKDN